MTKYVDLTIIIVNFNTLELTLACVDSIEKSDLKKNSIEIIIIDNGSTDDSRDTLGQLAKKRNYLSVIHNSQNKGFSTANNQGIVQAKGEYILLLNSDTHVYPQTISGMITFMENNPQVGAATAKLVLPDGNMDPASHRGFPTPWASVSYYLGFERTFPGMKIFGEYHQGYKDMKKPHEVDCISGAFFLVRKSVVNEIGLLDEQFFMYGEDIDWCMRIKNAGWKIMFNPDYEVLHKKKQSGRLSGDSLLRSRTNEHFYNAMRLFYQKHYEHRYGWFTKTFILIGIKLRSFMP